MTGIYLIINCLNLKFYVGSAINVIERIKCHKRELETNNHANKHLQNAWNKYGEDTFHFCIVEECSANELYKIEQIWIDSTNCCNCEIGYNKNKNAHGASIGNQFRTGILHSEEAKKKMSAASKGKPKSESHKLAIKNRVMTPEHCKKISEGQKGRIQNEETRRKIGEKNKLYIRGEAYSLAMSKAKKGKKFTEDHKKKLSEAAKARWNKLNS